MMKCSWERMKVMVQFPMKSSLIKITVLLMVLFPSGGVSLAGQNATESQWGLPTVEEGSEKVTTRLEFSPINAGKGIRH